MVRLQHYSDGGWTACGGLHYHPTPQGVWPHRCWGCQWTICHHWRWQSLVEMPWKCTWMRPSWTTSELEACGWALCCCGRCVLKKDIFCSICYKTCCRLQSQGHAQICGGGCGIVWYTQHSGCIIAMVLLFVYGHFRQFWGGHALDAACLKRVILFANGTSLKGAVMSYVMSQHCMCIGYMTFYYKRSTDASVGGLVCCSSVHQV